MSSRAEAREILKVLRETLAELEADKDRAYANNAGAEHRQYLCGKANGIRYAIMRLNDCALIDQAWDTSEPVRIERPAPVFAPATNWETEPRDDDDGALDFDGPLMCKGRV